MAGQGIDRREMLRALALAAAASGFPGFERWVFAHDHTRAAKGNLVSLPGASYQPQFFSPDEYATVARLAELIIPSDGSPGAREAGVSEFIDYMVANDVNLQFKFRYGLAWLDTHALRLHGRVFRELDAAIETELLKHLAYREHLRPGEDEGRDFFKLVREYTVMGFYTTRIGLEQLGYPGLEFYAESPECPHVDDREHRRLAAGVRSQKSKVKS